MKRFLKSGKARIIIIAMLLTFATQASSHRRLNVWYMQSNLPGQCLFPASLPDACTSSVQEVLCSFTSGTVTVTYYKTSSCISPYWRKP